MQYPKISIITPSYNQGQFIEETILSVINQSYSNIEFIIIDGGSTDNTVKILEKYNNKITYWVSEKDKGTYDANNKAIEMMTGDYWCVVNSDDTLLPNALHEIAACIAETKSEWIVGGEHIIDVAGNLKAKQMPVRPKQVSGLSFLNRNWIFHPATFIHAGVVEKVGLFAAEDSMDYDYWLRMEIAGYTPFILNEYLCSLRFHLDCKSADYIQQYDDIVRLLQQTQQKLEEANWPFPLKELHNNIDSWKTLKLKTETLQLLFRKERSKALLSLSKLWLYKPNLIYQRWFLGLLARFIKPVEEKEFNPLHDIL